MNKARGVTLLCVAGFVAALAAVHVAVRRDHQEPAATEQRGGILSFQHEGRLRFQYSLAEPPALVRVPHGSDAYTIVVFRDRQTNETMARVVRGPLEGAPGEWVAELDRPE